MSARSSCKKIWIDLDNSPHVPFFLPIIEGLETAGYKVFLTARDSYQVCELLRLYDLSCRVVGRHYGKRKILKLFGTGLRALQLLPLAIVEKPDLAVSHGSRAQFLTGSLLGIPTVVMLDYEFANFTSFLHPDWLFVPEVIPAKRVSQKLDHVFRYQGIKEDVYVPRLKPDPGLRNLLGTRDDEILVTIRPPATEAHYHNPEGEEFLARTVDHVLGKPDARIVMLPRNEKQAIEVRTRWSQALATGRMIIPERAVDGLNLIWSSDLVVSGGGTMNREATAVGVPVYSIFRGRLGAVDQYLANSGRLTVVDRLDDIATKIALKRRVASQCNGGSQSETLDRILEAVISIAENKCLPAYHSIQ